MGAKTTQSKVAKTKTAKTKLEKNKAKKTRLSRAGDKASEARSGEKLHKKSERGHKTPLASRRKPLVITTTPTPLLHIRGQSSSSVELESQLRQGSFVWLSVINSPSY